MLPGDQQKENTLDPLLEVHWTWSAFQWVWFRYRYPKDPACSTQETIVRTMYYLITWAVISPSSHPALSHSARLEDSKPTSSASVSWCPQELMNMFQAISHYEPVCFYLCYSWVWGPWRNCLAWLPRSAWVLRDLANIVDLPKRCIIILQAKFLGNFLANAETFLCRSKLLPLLFLSGQ